MTATAASTPPRTPPCAPAPAPEVAEFEAAAAVPVAVDAADELEVAVTEDEVAVVAMVVPLGHGPAVEVYADEPTE